MRCTYVTSLELDIPGLVSWIFGPIDTSEGLTAMSVYAEQWTNGYSLSSAKLGELLADPGRGLPIDVDGDGVDLPYGAELALTEGKEISALGVPAVGRGSAPRTTGGAVVLTFDVCEADSNASICRTGLGGPPVRAGAEVYLGRGGRVRRAWVMGSGELDVTDVDEGRLALSLPSFRAERVGYQDKDRDGHLDLWMEVPTWARLRPDEVHCVYGRLFDETPLLACAPAGPDTSRTAISPHKSRRIRKR